MTYYQPKDWATLAQLAQPQWARGKTTSWAQLAQPEKPNIFGRIGQYFRSPAQPAPLFDPNKSPILAAKKALTKGTNPATKVTGALSALDPDIPESNPVGHTLQQVWRNDPGVLFGGVSGPKTAGALAKAMGGGVAAAAKTDTKALLKQIGLQSEKRWSKYAPEIISEVAEQVGGGKNPLSNEALKFKLEAYLNTASRKIPERAANVHTLRQEQMKGVAEAFKKTSGVEALKAGRAAERGTAAMPEFTSKLQWLPEETDRLVDMAKQYEFGNKFTNLNAMDALNQLVTNSKIPTPAERSMLVEIFGKDTVSQLEKLRTTGQKVKDEIISTLNIPRAIQSSYDLSAPLRQGIVMQFGHPVESLKSYRSMFKAWGSEKAAQEAYAIQKARPYFQLGEDFDIGMTSWKSNLSDKEEAFMSNFTQKIPGVRASERAYVTYLNEIRSRVWNQQAELLKRVGATDKDYEAMARIIRAATGRGDLPGNLKAAAPLLNTIFWSPRLMASRLEMPVLWATGVASKNPVIQREAARQMVTFLGAGTTMLGLLTAAGAEVEWDARSSDFGKLKIGNTRIDIWGGFIQYARYAAQIATGQAKTGDDRIIEANRWDKLLRFGQSKFAPLPSFIADMMAGKDYIGNDMVPSWDNAKKQAYQRLMPLFIQGMIDAIRTDGWAAGAATAPSLFGMGTATYEQTLGPAPAPSGEETGGTTSDDWGLEDLKKQYGLK